MDFEQFLRKEIFILLLTLCEVPLKWNASSINKWNIHFIFMCLKCNLYHWKKNMFWRTVWKKISGEYLNCGGSQWEKDTKNYIMRFVIGTIHDVNVIWSMMMTERELSSKMWRDYASCDMGCTLCKWANRNKVFKILTVDSIREQWIVAISQLGE